jgi:hypothetical protein
MLLITFENVLYLVYELPEDGTDVPEHVAVLKDYTFTYVYKLCIDLVLLTDVKLNAQNGELQSITVLIYSPIKFASPVQFQEGQQEIRLIDHDNEVYTRKK